jgi:hypothetical protein
MHNAYPCPYGGISNFVMFLPCIAVVWLVVAIIYDFVLVGGVRYVYKHFAKKIVSLESSGID